MSLLDLIRRNRTADVATAIPATDATEQEWPKGSVAGIATVAVASSQQAFDHDAFEERAAIMEYDGGLERADAERLALLLVLQSRGVSGVVVKP